MRIFLAIAAILAWLFGAALLFAPMQFYAPAKIEMTPMLATIAQAHGATLVGLGVIDWMARNADPGGARAVLAGNLVVQVLSLGVVFGRARPRLGRWMSPVSPTTSTSATGHRLICGRSHRHALQSPGLREAVVATFLDEAGVAHDETLCRPLEHGLDGSRG